MGGHLKDTLVAYPGNSFQLPRYVPTQGINTPLPPPSLISFSSLFISPHPHPWIPPTKTFHQIFYPPHTFHQVFHHQWMSSIINGCLPSSMDVFHHQLKLHHFFYPFTSTPDEIKLVVTMPLTHWSPSHPHASHAWSVMPYIPDLPVLSLLTFIL